MKVCMLLYFRSDITFFRLQSTSDAKLTAYVAQGEVLPVATRSFGAIGIFAIPQMGRFYRHWLIEKNFPHHGAVAFGHFGKHSRRLVKAYFFNSEILKYFIKLLSEMTECMGL